MKDLQLEITLESDALVGSGESYGSIIDGDVVFESNGLPYIPAKRIKGCLRDSAEELLFLFHKADPEYKIKNEIDLEACFGQRYSEEKKGTKEEDKFRGDSGKVYYNNLMLSGYKDLSNWLHFIYKKNSNGKINKDYANLFSKEAVLAHYTRIKRQTSIDAETGTAKNTSLRTMRVLKKSLVFQGNISIPDEKKILYTLALAVSNFQSLGTSRNRGLGSITAKLKENKIDVTKKYLEELKAKCK